MNSDQRRYEQNNPHISNEMHHNHDSSCGCGCQQGKYEQNNEEYQNIVNEQISQGDDASYSYHNQGTMYSSTEDYMQNDKNCNESCWDNPTQLNTPNLPIESRRFQTITLANSGQNRGIDALRTTPGQLLGADLGAFCRTVAVRNQVVNDWLQGNGNRQRFLFYSTDRGDFVIANQQFGEVLTGWPDNNDSVTTEMYNGDSRQFFRKRELTSNQFQLQSRNNYYLGTCGTIAQVNSWTRFVIDSIIGQNLIRSLFKHTASESITNIPTFSPPTSLNPVPQLTSLDDLGPGPNQAERAVIGSALIPSILVNDVIPLDQRIRQSPYYKLEYRQYWHRTWSDEIPPFSIRTQRETLGIGGAAQGDMRHTVDISIGADFNLRFGNRSSPFLQQIIRGLNLYQSSANSDLGQKVVQYDRLNNNNVRTRFSVFRKAHEFVLTRADGTTVGTTHWSALDDRSILVRTFPTNSVLTIDNQKIIKADNSYDLSVFKTPLIIKDGEIKNKEYPCDE